MTFGSIRDLPTILAVIITVINAIKPVVVDDTAYLFFARHIVSDPLHPYQFDIFWYSKPYPAMTVLLPPVLPYWLALGMVFCGEHLFLLKLWLFPFAWIFCQSTAFFLHRFAPRRQRDGLFLIAFSAAVLPLFNFMLDVPAIALGLASVACLMRGTERKHLRWVVLAGVLAALAAQTKYTMITLPAVLLWYGWNRQSWRETILAVGIAIILFIAWEEYLFQTTGESHFVYQLHDQQPIRNDLTLQESIQKWFSDKWDLAKPLVAYLGGLAVVAGLYAGRAVGFPRVVVMLTALATVVGLVAVCTTPYSQTVVLANTRTQTPILLLSELVFNGLGTALLVTMLVSCLMLLIRRKRWKLTLRLNSLSLFLVGWLLIEIGAYFVLTPFPAARRVMMIAFLLLLIACRVAMVRAERWVVAFGVLYGCTIFALDCWDAYPERQLVSQATAAIGDRNGNAVWTRGHWGWQYYADREGMKLVQPGVTQIHKGDWLVLPLIPDDLGFYRPYHGGADFIIDAESVQPISEHVWDDWLPYQTVPTLYGGFSPILGRDHPRLRVGVYRATRDWTPQPVPATK